MRSLDLFALAVDTTRNLLPGDGEVYDHGRFVDDDTGRSWRATLLTEVPWSNDEAVINGQRIVVPRKVAWYGDDAWFYTYSGTTKQALTWTPTLLAVKARVEDVVGVAFNACLLNLYENGDQGVSWHSDDEAALGRNTTIASLSLGATRRFDFKHKRDGRRASIDLDDGRLIVMTGATQTHWLHQIPKQRTIRSARLNL
ncbi:MAG TPA: alpha-ketoglutarate-dependent dioxygenase AlkB, partial [Myxococcota bacterium]